MVMSDFEMTPIPSREREKFFWKSSICLITEGISSGFR
jgi:hypothetical protein